MINYLKLFILSVIFISTADIYSQSISGKVTDHSNSEPLVGAVVKIAGTSNGTLTDYDGTYLLESLSPGNYELEISYIGYTTVKIKNASVARGENRVINVTLKVDGLTTEEITVESSPSLSNEQSLLTEQKNSSKIQDGISEQQIKRSPDASASDVLKRVTGVSIVDNKYVFVRGTSERYSNTTLNGVLVPSTETDKKSFSFDLFPAKLLENIIIAKSFTPDLPGNFSGGLVQLNTKDFVDQFVFGFETNGSILSGTSFDNGFYSYNAGQKKILFFNSGIDDGGRSLPSNFPATTFSGRNNFGKTFRNNWGQNNNEAPANGGFQLSLGNRFNVFNNPLGILFSYTYRNSFENNEIDRNVYNSDTTSLINYKGRSSKYSVLNGGILNLNYKLGNNNRISLKNTFSVNSDDLTQFYEGLNFIKSTLEKKVYGTEFSEKTLFSTTASGNHYINNLNDLNIDWYFSYSDSKRNDPDVKSASYQKVFEKEGEFFMPLSVIPFANVGQRFFSDLYDKIRNTGVNFDMKFLKIAGKQSKIKFGGDMLNTERYFSARLFSPINFGSFMISFQPIETIFGPENIDSSVISYVEITNKSDSYSATENVYSSFMMFDIPINKLRIITGLRFEYSEQNISGFKRTTQDPINVKDKYNNYLPSLNLTYSLNDKTNIRASLTQTVSRPELREKAPFGFIDFVTEGELSGNPELEQSLVQNYDLRYELFPAAGEIASVSLFYKHFNQPIEKIIVPTGSGAFIPSYTFENAKNGAVNYGIEIEIRKKLGFIAKELQDFTFNGNLTFVNSKVNLEDLQSGANETERRLQGQSPYLINAGIFYDNYDLGFGANILFNRFGDKITEVGRIGFNNVIEKGRNVLDFSLTKSFLNNFEAKFIMKDLLNEPVIFTQDYNLENGETVTKDVRKILTGTNYGLTLSYKF